MAVETVSPIAMYNVSVRQPTGAGDIQQVEIYPGITLIDVNVNGTTYYGFAAAGTITSVALWKILAQATSGTVTSYLYANGAPTYVNIWDNRTSLSYS